MIEYDAFPELMTLPFMMTLYGYLWIRYKNRTKKEVMFRRMVLFVMLAIVFDGIISYTNNNESISNGAIIIFNTIDHIASTCASYSMILYVYSYIEEQSTKRKVFSYINQGVLFLLVILLMQNLITGNVFGYNETGNYYEGPLFQWVAYGIPLYFELYAVSAIIGYHKCFRKHQLIAISLGFLVSGVFVTAQLIFQHYLFVLAGSALSMFVVFLSHETPDYYELEQTMEELRESREEEMLAKIQALEASEAKTQFLSQMSHEIRTPINAILGYNNIIMEDTDDAPTRENARKARLAARRLLDFFDSVFNYIDIENGQELLKSISEVDFDDESEEMTEDDIKSPFNGAEYFRILIVDDTEMNVDLLERILRTMGFESDSAPDGEKAVELIRKTRYDLIFMDHMMPVMDGMEAMEIIKKEHLCDDTPVIMLTANTVKGEREKYLAAGFTEYITKPFNENSIKDVLLKYLPIDAERIDQAAWPPEWKALQKELPFLRLSVAKEYFLGDADFYIEALRNYATTTIVPKLEEYIELSDYYNYRAMMCCVKDASRLIGADKIAERAAAIENLYIKGNIEDMKIKHIAFIEDAKKLIKQLATALYLTDEDTALINGLGQMDMRPLILVIDDDRLLCNMIEKILSKYYRVLSVMTGEEGIIRAQEDSPALILLDVNLISMDGFDVIRALTSIEETSEIPVVFMTADESGEAEVKGFKSGGADFVRKPFVPEVLISRVRRIIELTALQKHLRREIKRQTEKIGHLSREVMLALSKAVDAKDKYTNDHSQRVAKYAAWIGKHLGKTKKEQEDLYIIGLLHDVGKIGVHEEIINKPGKLTDEEYEEVKSHTTVGYDILRVITEMPEAAKCARWHHERYDGKGYPDGLAGTDIPEEARIICVADSYDAMTSRRAYQALKPQEEVREEMIRCKGTQFDPVIADAMLRIIDEDYDYTLHG